MKIAYFDCQFGASGDMLLGALLAAGLPFSEWQEELAKLDLARGGFAVELKDVIRCSISCKKILISENGGEEDAIDAHELAQHAQSESGHAQCGHSDHGHSDHGHSDAHAHTEHAHGESAHTEHAHTEHAHTEHAHGESAHTDHGFSDPGHGGRSRNLQAILQLIEKSGITGKAKALAAEIFTRLGEAEAKIHGIPLFAVQFHEVGAIDSIVDIVGFAIAYDMLKIERSYVSPLPLGSGTVKTQHGIFPVPAPAAVLLLSDAHASISGKILNHECLTPTGAAILATISSGWCMPEMERIETIGYGAGTFNPQEFPNACRVFLAHSRAASTSPTPGDQRLRQLAGLSFNIEIIAVLEANLDDLSPQTISFAMDRLFEAGALDVSVLPAMMKKGRSGHLLTVICDPAKKAKLERIVLTQTSSLGVRSYLAERLVAEREWQEVKMDNGAKIRIKIARDLDGHVINAQPEYDDCAAYAAATDIPLKEVIVDALTNLKNNHKDHRGLREGTEHTQGQE